MASEHIRILSLNSNGYSTKREDIMNTFNRLNLNVLCLQESHVIPPGDVAWIERNKGIRVFTSNDEKAGVAIFTNEKVKQCYPTPVNLGGRLCHVELESGIHVVSLYVPTQNPAKIHLGPDYFKEVSNYLRGFRGGELFLAGDYNFAVEDADRSTGARLPGDIKYKAAFSEHFARFDLHDMFRDKHGMEVRSFTFHRGRTASRIDRIYTNIVKLEYEISHVPIVYSDHQAVLCVVRAIERCPRGRGFWKLNGSLLGNPQVREAVTRFWLRWQGRKMDYPCPIAWWEIGKKKVRNILKSFGIKLRKEENKERNDLERQLFGLYKDRDSGNMGNIAEIVETERKIKELDKKEFEGAKVRARAPFVEPDEAPTQAFFKMEVRKENRIYEIRDKDGNLVKEPQQIVKEFSEFYRDLYKMEPINDIEMNFFLNKIENSLNEEEKSSLEGMITTEEVHRELKEMQGNKSPGLDGLTKEFYLSFWEVIGDDLVETVNNVFLTENLSETMRTAVISVLFKKGDPAEVKNYRPVSLLTVDYKVITKVLKTRLSKVMSSLVDPEQACGVPGRSINDQLLNLQAVIEHAGAAGGALVAIDLMKAFDRLSHRYMREVLQRMNFGENFLKWIDILYKRPESMVLVNGFLSERFQVGRSVRQGCPLSALLFALCQEPLASAIRSETKIKGIKIPNFGKEIKNIQFADDATHPISAPCIHAIFQVYERYEEASGSKVNKEKTEILLLGRFQIQHIPVEYRRYVVDVSKILGIPWSKYGAHGGTFWKTVIGKIEKEIEKWGERRLSFTGKVLAIKTVLLSKIWYGARVLKIPKEIVGKIDTMLFKFLWSGRTELIKRASLFRPIREGGLGMTHVAGKCSALLMMKLNALYKVNPGEVPQPWVGYGIYRLGVFLRQYCPAIGTNCFVHNPVDAGAVWGKVRFLVEQSKITREGNFWLKATLAKIYGEMKYMYQEPHTVCVRKPHIRWEYVWKNIWTAKASNAEKEFIFKTAHGALPVKTTFKGLPGISKSCTLCKREPETTEHLFFDCPRVQAALNSLRRVCVGQGWPQPLIDGVLYPDFPPARGNGKRTLALFFYTHSIWVARAAAWAGRKVRPEDDFMRRVQGRLY